MPTEIERKVLNLLSAVDFSGGSDPGPLIASWGNEAVTLVCEIALDGYPGLLPKVRTNAVAVLETVDHPQSKETVRLLVKDTNSDISIRALRAAAGQRNTTTVRDMASMLQSTSLQPLVAVEVVKALSAIATPEARAALASYTTADRQKYPHRANALVSSYLEKAPK
ncbi:HEAT repeat domain-containing protein [Paraburkholderia strydomiana]|uniref:HEAT repeat domain-containing protein n=1 Tax=Paraburkholderia strydomiana TaxID=1245417 RepID=UPI0038B9866D